MFNLRTELEGLDLVIDGRHTTAQSATVELALRIADIFTELCKTRLGETPPINKKNAIHFYKAAELCQRLEETPELFVTKQMRGMTQFSKFWVSAISSERLHQLVDDEVNVTLEAVRYYKSQLALFGSRCRLCGPAVAIQDTANEFSPLFRFIIASEIGLAHVAAQYREGAEQELNLNPVARDVFGTKLERFGLAADRAALPPAASSDSPVTGDS